jgi:hypothetical protein
MIKKCMKNPLSVCRITFISTLSLFFKMYKLDMNDDEFSLARRYRLATIDDQQHHDDDTVKVGYEADMALALDETNERGLKSAVVSSI